MAAKTAIAVALACSIGLASTGACVAALRFSPGALPSIRQSVEPFGLIAFPISDGPLKRKWSALEHELADDKVQLALCDIDRVGCPSPPALEVRERPAPWMGYLLKIELLRERSGRCEPPACLAKPAFLTANLNEVLMLRAPPRAGSAHIVTLGVIGVESSRYRVAEFRE